MTGKVTLEVAEDGNLHVDTKLSDVSYSDKAWMLHCLASVLDMDIDDLQIWMEAEMSFRAAGTADYVEGDHNEG